MKSIIGYSDKLSVRPGETIEFKISVNEGKHYSAQLVRLVCGSAHSDSLAFKEVEIPSSVNAVYTGRRQSIIRGSYIAVEHIDVLEGLEEFTLLISFMPTTPAAGLQHLVSRWDAKRSVGWTLHLTNEAQLAFTFALSENKRSTVVSSSKLKPKQWYRAVVRVAPSRNSLELVCQLYAGPALFQAVVAYSDVIQGSLQPMRASTPLMMAAAFMECDVNGFITPADCFNGRLESPVIYKGLLTESESAAVFADERPAHLADRLFADWDFSQGIAGSEIVDRSPSGLHGRAHNLPLRAVRGLRWNRSAMAWTDQPSGYGAIHFHCDDIYDCRWSTDIKYRVDAHLISGIYALRLRQGEEEEYLPFFVAPPRHKPRSKMAFVVPTYTYLAYGNARALTSPEARRRAKEESGLSADAYAKTLMTGPGTEDYFHQMDENQEIGSSTYNLHADGTPVHFSSWLRPLLNMRPKSIWWTFCADLLTIDWLEAAGFDYDIITDDLLHSEGVSLLRDYRVVMTGNHPEYVTSAQLDSIQAYLDGGGRLMYLGGNGYYWRTAVHPAFPGVIEVRRGRGATQTWKSDVGEQYLAFTGELGGIWRDIGRPPQQLFGVGFVAQGSDASYYRIARGARESRAAFALEGIDEEFIGNFGSIGGGAAGQEIDQTNADYGTPPHTLILARSENHGPNMVYVIEEMDGNLPLAEHYGTKIGAEIAFFETPNGGAVFTVGSMAWCGSLAHNNYKNNVARITANVLRRFLRSEGFGGGPWA